MNLFFSVLSIVLLNDILGNVVHFLSHLGHNLFLCLPVSTRNVCLSMFYIPLLRKIILEIKVNLDFPK